MPVNPAEAGHDVAPNVAHTAMSIRLWPSALEIAQQRYARGEISRDEFLGLKSDLTEVTLCRLRRRARSQRVATSASAAASTTTCTTRVGRRRARGRGTSRSYRVSPAKQPARIARF